MARLISYIIISFCFQLFFLNILEAKGIMTFYGKDSLIISNPLSNPEHNLIDSNLHLKLIKTIKGEYKDFTIDNLGNIFLISSSNQIKKLDNNYDSFAIFNDSKRFGDIFSIDVSNPLKVLVYYKDFATILTLDRQLNIKNVIDLRQQNISQVRAIAQSYDNNIWLFDEEDYKLKKIDDYGKLLSETPDFRLLFDGGTPYLPKNIIDMNGLLYLYHPKGGWKIFDYYGGFKTQYAFNDWQDVSVADGFLIGHDNLHFFAERPKDLQSLSNTTDIDLNKAKKVIVWKNIYYLLTQEGIEIYNSL